MESLEHNPYSHERPWSRPLAALPFHRESGMCSRPRAPARQRLPIIEGDGVAGRPHHPRPPQQGTVAVARSRRPALEMAMVETSKPRAIAAGEPRPSIAAGGVPRPRSRWRSRWQGPLDGRQHARLCDARGDPRPGGRRPRSGPRAGLWPGRRRQPLGWPGRRAARPLRERVERRVALCARGRGRPPRPEHAEAEESCARAGARAADQTPRRQAWCRIALRKRGGAQRLFEVLVRAGRWPRMSAEGGCGAATLAGRGARRAWGQ